MWDRTAEPATLRVPLDLLRRCTRLGISSPCSSVRPDGRTLFGMMQNALIQDHGLNGLDRLGLNNRIIRIDLTTGQTNEYV
jgi:hypothetical protein